MTAPAASVRHILAVCLTCHRYAARVPGEPTPGERLADRLEELLADMDPAWRPTLRRVECLSGCRHPCNVSLAASGKARLRLNHIGPEHAGPLVALARHYVGSGDGNVRPAAESLGMEGRIASVIPAITTPAASN